MPKGVERKMDTQEEIVRLLAIDLRLRLGSQGEVIQELNKAGFGPTRIAELIGTTPNTVNVTIQKAKKRLATTKTKEQA
jgi:DNA-directed RNA polymerase specialized sigma24 family protein